MRDISETEIKQLERLKQYFPYRHVFGVIDNNGNFDAYATPTKRKANDLARKGNKVLFLEYA